MNYHIKRLAEQAGIKIAPMVVDGIEYEYEDVEMDGSGDLEKFAKLLIKETLLIAKVGIEYGPSMEQVVHTYFGVDQ